MEEKRQRRRKIDVSETGKPKRRPGNAGISDRKKRSQSSGRVKRLGDSEVLERERNLDVPKRKKKSVKGKTNGRASRIKGKKQRRRNIIGRTLQIILAAALVCVLFFVVRNFGEGNKLNRKGLDAYAQADYEMANEYFTKAIEYDGGNGEYYMNQGMARSELKLYDEAMDSFNKALEHMKRDKDIQLVYRAMGISRLYQGNYEEALKCFDQALDGKENRFSETEKDILYYKAETQDKAGKYVDAVMTYTQLVDSEKSADAYMLRGMEYVKVGDGTSAESDLRTAIKKDKKNYEIYLALYEALIAQNKTEDAKVVLNEALELGGGRAKDLVNQGNIYLKLGDLTAAEEKLQKALEKGEISANLGLAELSIQKNPADYALACQYYETYLTEVKDNVTAYNDYGQCLMAMGDYAKAETIFTQGVALNNRLMDRRISKNQIVAAEQAGHWEKALEYVNVYLDKYSDDSAAVREKAFIQTRIR